MYPGAQAASARQFDNRITTGMDLKDPMPVSNVQAQLNELQQLLAGAHDRFGYFVQKVSPGLRPLPPGTSGQPMKEGIVGSPLAEALRADVIAARQLVERINEAIDAVDL